MGLRIFFAHFLFVLAAWTLLIKFILPMVWAGLGDQNLTSLVLWDFWWVAHIWLGWSLLVRPRYLITAAVVVSLLEITIVVVKFVLFLQAPDWTIWTMNWFVNKVFVLTCFVMLLSHVLVRPEKYRIAAESSS